MRNILYVTDKVFTEIEFARLVEEFGGLWNTEIDPKQAVISDDPAAIYIMMDANIAAEYEPAELDELIQKLGGQPKSGVDIHIGHGAGSEELANKIANTLIERWGGIIDES